MLYNKIVAYSDGSANVKTKQGGIGCYIQYYYNDELVDELKYSEGYIETTVNRMELTAIISVLSFIETHDVEVIVVSDSQICVKGINEWYDMWVKENRTDVKNRDLWDILMKMKAKFSNITFIHTRGHKKGEEQYHYGNNIVDKLADYRNFIHNENEIQS